MSQSLTLEITERQTENPSPHEMLLERLLCSSFVTYLELARGGTYPRLHRLHYRYAISETLLGLHLVDLSIARLEVLLIPRAIFFNTVIKMFGRYHSKIHARVMIKNN